MTPAFDRTLLHPRYWLTWIGLGLFAGIAWLPWKARRWLGTRLGQLMYRHNTKRRHIAETNLRLCFPEHDDATTRALVRAHLIEYACALLDYSLLFFRSRKWLYHSTQIYGLEHVTQAIANQHNVILILGHSVWLEFAPLAFGQHHTAYASYKAFKNPCIDWLVLRSRSKDLEFLVSRDESMIKLVRALKPGKLMIFLPDEDHGIKHSVFANFFGIPKATLTTPARLASLGNAKAIPVMAFFNTSTGMHEVHVGEALANFPTKNEIMDATLMNQGLEQLIRTHPAQYMWLLKLFRTRPTGEKNVY